VSGRKARKNPGIFAGFFVYGRASEILKLKKSGCRIVLPAKL